MRHTVRIAVVVGWFVLLIARVACAQSVPLPSVAFDAASIRPRNAGESYAPIVVGIKIAPGRLTDQCADLNALIFFAYNQDWGRPITGLPQWAKSRCGRYEDTYEIQSTMPADTTQEQARRMMQSLLAERFKLVVHWEKKKMPTYALVVGPNGFKLKPVDPNAPPVYGNSLFPCPQDDPSCHILPMSPGPISGLATALSSLVGRPVIDKSAIADSYDRMLKWAGDTTMGSSLPSLPTLLREKYGLELKSESDPVDVLVVDHAEKPTPN
jgi:uncharacterized protein (TIGR03435 family)